MPALQSIYEMDKPCNFSCFFTVMTNVSSAVWVWRVVSTSEDGVVRTNPLFVLSNVGEGGGGVISDPDTFIGVFCIQN